MTKREIIYFVLDSIKSTNGDSYITEEHVLFLMNAYKAFLIDLKKKQDKLFKFTEEYYLEICLDLELVDAIPGLSCNGLQYLKSILKIPTLLDSDTANIYPYDLFNFSITNIDRERFKYVGSNKYLLNIIYSTIGTDNHLYIKSSNPQFKYMEKVRLSGVFEDSELADELACDNTDDGECIDSLDRKFSMPAELIPQMIDTITKLLKLALYSPADDLNDSRDTIADLMTFIRRNMKNNFLKQLGE